MKTIITKASPDGKSGEPLQPIGPQQNYQTNSDNSRFTRFNGNDDNGRGKGNHLKNDCSSTNNCAIYQKNKRIELCSNCLWLGNGEKT